MLSINLISRCNQDCFFCKANTVGNLSKSPTTEEVKRQIKEYDDTQDASIARSVMFLGGGEPTMREDLPELIAYSRQLGFNEVFVETNGVKFSDIDYVELLVKSGLTSCNVSLHSHMESVSDKITDSPGTFKQTIAGLRNLLERGIRIGSVLFVINSLNYREIKEFIDFLREEFPQINTISFSFIRPFADDELSASYTPRLSEVELELYDSIEYGIKKGMTIRIMGGAEVPLCFLPGHEHLSSYLAYYLDLPRELMLEEMHAAEKEKPASCSLCTLSGICLGISKVYLSIYGEDEFYPLFLDPLQIIEKTREEKNKRRP